MVPVHHPPLPPPQPQGLQHKQNQHQQSSHSNPKTDSKHMRQERYRGDRRREFKESARWHERSSSPSSSNRRSHSKTRHTTRDRSYDRETSNGLKYSSKNDKDRNRERVRDRDNVRDKDRDRCRDKSRIENKDRNRARDSDGIRERRDRNCDERERKNDRITNKSRSRSRSKSKRKSPSFSRNKSAQQNIHTKCDRSKSYDSRRHRSSSRTSVRRSPSSIKSHHDNETQPSEEKTSPSDAEKTERARILEKWRSNFCETSEDITRKLEELAEDNEKECWVRSSPSDLHYKRTSVNEIEGTTRLEALCTLFKTELVDRGDRMRKEKPVAESHQKKRLQRVCRHKSKHFGVFKLYHSL